MSFGTFADPRAFVIDVFSGMRPPTPVSVLEFNREHRYLLNQGATVGRWDPAFTPHVIQPTHMVDDRRWWLKLLVGPGQSAKTTVAENWLSHKVPNNPGNMLWYMQSDDTVKEFVKTVIEEMIAEHEHLRTNLGLRPVDDSLGFKRFQRMWVSFLAANRGNMISRKAPNIVLDETDAYAPGLGDPFKHAGTRTQTFGSNANVLAMSHCDRADGPKEAQWNAGILRAYRDSTQGRYYMHCPECDLVSTMAPGGEWVMTLIYPEDPDTPLEEVAAGARLICPHNGCAIEEHQRMDMVRGAQRIGGDIDYGWVHRGQTITAAGKVDGEITTDTEAIGWFWQGAMSPLYAGGIQKLARLRAEAERTADVTGDQTDLKDVVVKNWGLPYAIRKTDELPLDVKTLMARVNPDVPLGVVPDGVLFLTLAVDVQAHKFVVQTEGWGVDLQRWIVDRFEVSIPALEKGEPDRALQPAYYTEDWDRLAEAILDRAWPLGSDLDYGLKPVRLCYDAHGMDGVTDNAYAFWIKHGSTTNDRLMPLKGMRGRGSPRVEKKFIEAEVKDKYAGFRGNIPFLLVRTDRIKDMVNSALRRPKPGPRYVNFPAGLRDSFFEELTSEEKQPNGTWDKVKARNESWDLAVYNTANVLHLGAEHINWDNPPLYAVDGPDNPFRVKLFEAAPVAEAAARTPHSGGVKLAPAKPVDTKTLVNNLAGAKRG